MITAIVTDSDSVASHFTKAKAVLFLDQHGKELRCHANPALDSNCAGKKKLVDLIVRYQAERVVVRNIGQQMLQRLLAQDLAVYQITNGRTPLAAYAGADCKELLALTSIEQARPSPNHEAKGKEGGCCHGHDGEEGCDSHHSSSEKSCCGGEKKKSCCHH